MVSVIQLIHSRWYHFFPDLQLSADEFYTLAEAQVKLKEIPNLKIKRVKLFNRSWTTTREYLRIQGGDLVFDLCAAPYGTGYFISCWMGESKSFIYRVLAQVPILGYIMHHLSNTKTYFQWDSETMFQECVHTGIMEAVDAISSEKGMRMLSESERLMKRTNS